MDADIDGFYARHAAGGPSHIVMAIAVTKHDDETYAVFSTLAKARAWANGLDADEFSGVVFVPFVIDEPDFGNVPWEKQQ